MLTDRQFERTFSKLRRFEDTLNGMLFRKEAVIDNVKFYETAERLYEIPADSLCRPMHSGETWGSEEDGNVTVSDGCLKLRAYEKAT